MGVGQGGFDLPPTTLNKQKIQNMFQSRDCEGSVGAAERRSDFLKTWHAYSGLGLEATLSNWLNTCDRRVADAIVADRTTRMTKGCWALSEALSQESIVQVGRICFQELAQTYLE